MSSWENRHYSSLACRAQPYFCKQPQVWNHLCLGEEVGDTECHGSAQVSIEGLLQASPCQTASLEGKNNILPASIGMGRAVDRCEKLRPCDQRY